MSLQENLDAAIRQAFRTEQESDDRAGIVTEWALCCEVAGVDGEIWLHNHRSPGATVWRILGLLEAHAANMRAALTMKDGGEP